MLHPHWSDTTGGGGGEEEEGSPQFHDYPLCLLGSLCLSVQVAMFIVYILHQLAHRANMMVATRLFLHLIFAVMALEVSH